MFSGMWDLNPTKSHRIGLSPAQEAVTNLRKREYFTADRLFPRGRFLYKWGRTPGRHLICSHLQAPSTPTLSFLNTNHHSNRVQCLHANVSFIIDFPVSSPVNMQTWVSQNCMDPSVSLHSSLAYTRVRTRERENPKTELHVRWLQNICIVDLSLYPHRTPPPQPILI